MTPISSLGPATLSKLNKVRETTGETGGLLHD